MNPMRKKAATAVATRDDLLQDVHLLRVDPAEDVVQLSTALSADGAPPSPCELVIAASLAETENDLRWAKHGLREITRMATCDQIRIRCSAKRGSAPITALAAASQSGGRPGLAAAILEHGCSFIGAVALVRSEITGARPFEAELRVHERRRRHLWQDLKLMRYDRCPAFPGADLEG